jgi:hypothetical protein
MKMALYLCSVLYNSCLTMKKKQTNPNFKIAYNLASPPQNQQDHQS